MTIISLEDMRDHPSELLEKLRSGETLVLQVQGASVAEIKPIRADSSGELRPFGLCAGMFEVPDDFDDPLPEEILALFEK